MSTTHNSSSSSSSIFSNTAKENVDDTNNSSSSSSNNTGMHDTNNKFDQEFWENLWIKTLRDHGDRMGQRQPNAILTEYVAAPSVLHSPLQQQQQRGEGGEGDKAILRTALDAGCGHGIETIWLARHGWTVTAVDFSAAALAKGQSMADMSGVPKQQIVWVQSDLETWTSSNERSSFDLVLSLYVHIAGSVNDMIRRLANAVSPGGTLLLIGNHAVDPSKVLVPGQTQVTVEIALQVLDLKEWELLVAEERVVPKGVDSIICARRRNVEGAPLS